MTGYALTFAGLLVLVLAEQGWLRLRGGPPIDWLNMTANLNSGHLLLWLLRGVEVGAYTAVLQHASLGWIGDWPPAWQWIVGFIGWDFLFWQMHRAHHTIPLLWKVHAVHHQGTEMSFSLAIRNSWFSSLTDFPFMLPLAILGLPVEIFLAVSAFHYGVQFWNHIDPRLVGRLGVLDRFLVTPSNHRSHHGVQALYHNKNFGGTFLWDKLFGTYQPEVPELPAQYGLGGEKASSNPVLMNHPGLAPAFAAPRRAKDSPLCIGIGGILLFCAVAFAVDRAAGPGQVLLEAAIILGSIVLGAAADGLRAAYGAWLLTCGAILAWMLAYAPQPLGVVVGVALLAHAIVALWLAARAPDAPPG